MIRAEAFALIDKERMRQEELYPGSSIASALPLDTKLRILVEEVGEVAQAIDVAEKLRTYKRDPEEAEYTRDDALDHLRDELVQVAACAVGMLESLDEERIPRPGQYVKFNLTPGGK